MKVVFWTEIILLIYLGKLMFMALLEAILTSIWMGI